MLQASASPWARCRTSAEVHGPMPGRLRRARSAARFSPPRVRSSARGPARGAHQGRAAALLHAGRQEPPGRDPWPTPRRPARTRIPYAADSRSVAGPGAASPNSVTSSRNARNASLPVTTCSRQAGASASQTSVGPTDQDLGVAPLGQHQRRVLGSRPETGRVVVRPEQSWAAGPGPSRLRRPRRGPTPSSRPRRAAAAPGPPGSGKRAASAPGPAGGGSGRPVHGDAPGSTDRPAPACRR